MKLAATPGGAILIRAVTEVTRFYLADYGLEIEIEDADEDEVFRPERPRLIVHAHKTLREARASRASEKVAEERRRSTKGKRSGNNRWPLLPFQLLQRRLNVRVSSGVYCCCR